jgi:hypothetical protein
MWFLQLNENSEVWVTMKKTLILIMIAAAVGLYLYFYEIKGGEERQRMKELSERLIDLNADSVDTVAIHSAKGDFLFRKENNNAWKIVKPVETQGDKTAISSFVRELVNVKKKRSFTLKPNELAQFGLSDEKAVKIELRDSYGKRAVIKLGDKAAIGSFTYASANDSVVATIGDKIKRDAQMNLFHWRDKSVAHYNRSLVNAFTLVNPHGKFVFKKDAGKWMLSSPLKGLAEQKSVNAILSKFSYQKVKSVAEDNVKKLGGYGLYKPAYSLRISTGEEGKKEISLLFSKPKNGIVYGKNSENNYVFTLDTANISVLNKKLFDFRDKTIVKFDDKKADRINLLYNDRLNKLYKDSTNVWRGNDEKEADKESVETVLKTMKDLQVVKIVEENAVYFRQYGLKNPRGKIEVFSDNEKIAELEVGIIKNGGIYVRNPLNKRVFLVAEDNVEKLFPADSVLYKKKADK